MTDPERAGLDAQYNLRARVPDFQDHFDRYDRMSEALRARRAGQLDLAYGEGPREALDLYLPDRAAAPLLVFIHGGYWHSQDRKRFAFVAEPVLAAGGAVALLGYDLAPAVDLDAMVTQIRRALAWLWRSGPELGFERTRMVVAGHSAGGHLAAMAAVHDWALQGLPADLVKGLLPISGIFDLAPIRGCYLNDVLALDEAQVARNSPVRLPPGHAPAVVAVGERETDAFLEQSRRYVEHLRRHGRAAALLVRPGHDHFSIIQAMVGRDDPTTRAALRLLGLGGEAG